MKILVIFSVSVVIVTLAQCFAAVMPFECPKEGLFPVKENCTMYYRCASSGGLGKEEKCLANQVFYPEDSACVPGRCIIEDEDQSFRDSSKPGFYGHSTSCSKYIRYFELMDEGGGLRESVFDCAPGTVMWCPEFCMCVLAEKDCPSKCISMYE